MKEKNTKKIAIEMIVLGDIVAVLVFIFMSNVGEQDYAAAAANARVPLGEVFRGLFVDKFF